MATTAGVKARRGRPNKVTRDRIIEVAGTLGLDGLTIKSLAAELEVSPGALYRHVDGLDEIARLVAERKRDEVERRMTTTRDWAEWLRAFAEVIRTELGGSTSALLGSGDRRPMEIGVGESGLRLLIDAGLTPVEAAHALWLVVRAAATTGTPDRPSFVGFLDPTRELVDDGPTDRYRALDRVQRDLSEGGSPDSFPFELEVLLAGIAAQIDRRSTRRPGRTRPEETEDAPG